MRYIDFDGNEIGSNNAVMRIRSNGQQQVKTPFMIWYPTISFKHEFLGFSIRVKYYSFVLFRYWVNWE